MSTTTDSDELYTNNYGYVKILRSYGVDQVFDAIMAVDILQAGLAVDNPAPEKPSKIRKESYTRILQFLPPFSSTFASPYYIMVGSI